MKGSLGGHADAPVESAYGFSSVSASMPSAYRYRPITQVGDALTQGAETDLRLLYNSDMYRIKYSVSYIFS